MSQPELPFVFDQNTGLPLPDRIATYRSEINGKHVPVTDDRWVLASNLQKSIRRGLVPTAEAAEEPPAEQLH